MKKTSENTYLTVRQVAERFNTSIDSIYRWKRKGDFSGSVKFSTGTTRWRLSDIEDWESTFVASFAETAFFDISMDDAA